MKLTAVRLERGQIQMGACCDKTNGPAAAQLTVQDAETGKKYWCIYSEYQGEAECIAAKRDVLQSVCNLYLVIRDHGCRHRRAYAVDDQDPITIDADILLPVLLR